MSVFGVLNKAYANVKSSIPYDHGRGLDPMGKRYLTTYQAKARISKATRFPLSVSSGQLTLIELEEDLFPPQDPSPQGPASASSGIADRVAISGADGFGGEHDILRLDGVPRSPRRFIILDSVNSPNETEDNIELEDEGWLYFAPTSKGEFLVDPQRVISHPGFPQREGEGIYTYPFAPDITRNFAYHPVTKVDSLIQRTISSNVAIFQPQVEEDTIITEVWLGSDSRLSTLAEMYRVLMAYWTTLPAAGEVLGWEPRDITSDRFGIQIVNVRLGGLDHEYHEVRAVASQNQDAYLNRQLTLQFKLARRVIPSVPQIRMEGR